MQSDVFDSMLKSSYKNGKTSVIQIKDFEAESLYCFFMSLYAGYIVDANCADDLLALADKYRIDWLKVSQATFINLSSFVFRKNASKFLVKI